MAAGLGTQGTAVTPGRRPHGCHMVHHQQSSCGPCTSAGQPGTGTATAEKEQSGSPVHPERGDSGPRGAETPPDPTCPCPEWTNSPRLLLPRRRPACPAHRGPLLNQHTLGEAPDRDRIWKLGFWLADCWGRRGGSEGRKEGKERKEGRKLITPPIKEKL